MGLAAKPIQILWYCVLVGIKTAKLFESDVRVIYLEILYFFKLQEAMLNSVSKYVVFTIFIANTKVKHYNHS